MLFKYSVLPYFLVDNGPWTDSSDDNYPTFNFQFVVSAGKGGGWDIAWVGGYEKSGASEVMVDISTNGWYYHSATVVP